MNVDPWVAVLIALAAVVLLIHVADAYSRLDRCARAIDVILYALEVGAAGDPEMGEAVDRATRIMRGQE